MASTSIAHRCARRCYPKLIHSGSAQHLLHTRTAHDSHSEPSGLPGPVLGAFPCYTARLAMSSRSRLSPLRAAFWLTAIILGSAQAWGERHSIYSDGISYVEIATAYARHDWANAVNAYWSPLFSWVIALAFLALHPSPYWQAATAHLVMFVSYIVALLCFEFFMRELIRTQQSDPTDTEGM